MKLFDYAKLCFMYGKTVTHYTTHGCMATIHEFNYCGVIVGITYPRFGNGNMCYKIKVFKNKNGYILNKANKPILYEEIPSWHLRKLYGIYVAYD